MSEVARDMIYIVSRNDIVEYVNTSAADLFHKRAEEIIGITRASLFSVEISTAKSALCKMFLNREYPAMLKAKRNIWVK